MSAWLNAFLSLNPARGGSISYISNTPCFSFPLLFCYWFVYLLCSPVSCFPLNLGNVQVCLQTLVMYFVTFRQNYYLLWPPLLLPSFQLLADFPLCLHFLFHSTFFSPLFLNLPETDIWSRGTLWKDSIFPKLIERGKAIKPVSMAVFSEWHSSERKNSACLIQPPLFTAR